MGVAYAHVLSPKLLRRVLKFRYLGFCAKVALASVILAANEYPVHLPTLGANVTSSSSSHTAYCAVCDGYLKRFR
jgi:hypothetical protein